MINWSIKAIQNLPQTDREKWEKKTLYATDSEKCASGVYYSLKGEEPTNPDDPRGLRRMEVGEMVEKNQIKKLRKLGILIEAQRRIFDEDHNVSGRHDGIVISPEECTPRAKECILRKREIFDELEKIEKSLNSLISTYESDGISKEEFHNTQFELFRDKQNLFDEENNINKELLIPDPKNSLLLMEIKSIVEKGFDWREKEGQPMSSHIKQIMFYLWKLRDTYPNLLARVIYVDTSYQNLLEFDVQYDERIIDDLKKFWSMMNKALEANIPPTPAPSVVMNPMSKRWQVNFQAEWCKYHIKCTGDPNWLEKAKKKVEELNALRKSTRK